MNSAAKKSIALAAGLASFLLWLNQRKQLMTDTVAAWLRFGVIAAQVVLAIA